ncbi:MAG: ABC transporter substrate-binding protein [Actinomycetota bacterium]|nr:ABC transporter substrate-binding protein [Actinomycetota bacterium]
MNALQSSSRRRRATTGAIAAAGAVAITIGSGAGSLASASAERAAAIPTPAKVPAVAALVPKAIRARGSVKVAMDATYAPDEFVAANGKTIVGMDADLNAAIGAVMGVRWISTNATFDTIIPGLTSGKYDVGNSSFTITAARAKVVNFVSYFKAGEGYYVKSTSSIKLNGLASLCGLTVSVESGTTEQSDAEAANKSCTKSGKKGVSVLSFSDQNSANLAVASGRAQLGFADSQVAGYIVQQSHGKFKLDGAAFSVAPYGIAFPKSSGLDRATLAAVKVLMKDGVYAKILAKWGVQAGAITTPSIVG